MNKLNSTTSTVTPLRLNDAETLVSTKRYAAFKKLAKDASACAVALDTIAAAGLEAPAWMTRYFDSLGGDAAVRIATAPKDNVVQLFTDEMLASDSKPLLSALPKEEKATVVQELGDAFAELMDASMSEGELKAALYDVTTHENARLVLSIGAEVYWKRQMDTAIRRGCYLKNLSQELETMYETYVSLFMDRFGRLQYVMNTRMETPHFYKAWRRPTAEAEGLDAPTNFRNPADIVEMDEEHDGENYEGLSIMSRTGFRELDSTAPPQIHNLEDVAEVMEWVSDQEDFAGMSFTQTQAMRYWWEMRRRDVPVHVTGKFDRGIKTLLDTPPTPEAVARFGQDFADKFVIRKLLREGKRPNQHPLGVLGMAYSIKSTVAKQAFRSLQWAGIALEWIDRRLQSATPLASLTGLDGSMNDPSNKYDGGYNPYEAFDKDDVLAVMGMATLMPRAEWGSRLQFASTSELHEIRDSLSDAIAEAQRSSMEAITLVDEFFGELAAMAGWAGVPFVWKLDEASGKADLTFTLKEAVQSWKETREAYVASTREARLARAAKLNINI